MNSGQAVIGIAFDSKNENHNRIVLNNFNSGDSTFFDFKHSENISNLIANEELGTVLSAGFDKTLVQYDLRSGKVTKNYGDIGIYDIQSSAISGRFAIFGGQTEFKFINLTKKEIIYTNYIRTNSIYVYTLEFGRVKDEIVLICGGDSSVVNIYHLGEVLNNSLLYVPEGK